MIKRLVDAVLGFAKSCIENFAALEGVDRALALAAQAFSALFPVLILIAALEPTGKGNDIADTLIDRFGLSGEGADAVRHAFAAPESVKGSVTVISILFVIFSALAFARALQRLYEKAWKLESRGIKSTGWGLGWLVIFSLYWAIISALGDNSRPVIGLSLAFVLWLVTPYLLLERRIPWRTLVPQALLTAAGIVGVGIWSTVYMSRAVSTSAEQFGVVGVSFALLTWLVAMSFAIVAAATVGTAIHVRIHPRDDQPV
jgi:membrane protein